MYCFAVHLASHYTLHFAGSGLSHGLSRGSQLFPVCNCTHVSSYLKPFETENFFLKIDCLLFTSFKAVRKEENM